MTSWKQLFPQSSTQLPRRAPEDGRCSDSCPEVRVRPWGCIRLWLQLALRRFALFCPAKAGAAETTVGGSEGEDGRDQLVAPHGGCTGGRVPPPAGHLRRRPGGREWSPGPLGYVCGGSASTLQSAQCEKHGQVRLHSAQRRVALSRSGVFTPLACDALGASPCAPGWPLFGLLKRLSEDKLGEADGLEPSDTDRVLAEVSPSRARCGGHRDAQDPLDVPVAVLVADREGAHVAASQSAIVRLWQGRSFDEVLRSGRMCEAFAALEWQSQDYYRANLADAWHLLT